MGTLKGLKKINEYREAQEAKRQAYEDGDGGDFQKVKWFSLKNDGDSARVIFPQELDEDAKNYSSKNGIAFFAVEHANPDNFIRKALCTLDDEGACWACERRRVDGIKEASDGKGGTKTEKGRWRQQTRLYSNVLVEQPDGIWEVQVISQGNGDKSISPGLLEQATELGTITDKAFKIKRSGKEWNKTSYILTALAEHKEDVEAYELFDLDKVVRNVPYAKQEAHYLGGTGNSDVSAPADGHTGAEPTVGAAVDEW